MKINKAIPALAAGVLTALILVFGLWPVLAQTPLNIDQGKQVVQIANNPQTDAPDLDDDPILSVPAAAFGPDGADPSSYRFVITGGAVLGGGGGYMVGNARAYGCMQAPVYLPNDTDIVEMKMAYFDNDSGQDINLSLRRTNRSSGLIEILGTIQTSGAVNAISAMTTADITPSQIDNDNYNYYLYTCLRSGNTALYGVDLFFDQVFQNDLAVSLFTNPMVILPNTTAFSYQVTVSNVGVNQMVAAQLRVTISDLATIQSSAGPTCIRTGNEFNCNLGNLNAGNSVLLTVNVNIPSGFKGSLTSQAIVSSLTQDDNLSNNVATLTSAVGGQPISLPVVVQDADTLPNP